MGVDDQCWEGGFFQQDQGADSVLAAQVTSYHENRSWDRPKAGGKVCAGQQRMRGLLELLQV